MTTSKTCDACNKSGLSIALFRPAVIAGDARLAPSGSASLSVDKSLLDGLLPETPPTQSRPALRLLRMGYLHVYFEKAQPGGEHWQSYRVTERSELIPVALAGMINPAGEVVCSRSAHNAHALRSLHIPQAHKVGKVWVAFSANLWSDALKARNQADAQVMQCLDIPAILGGAIPRNGFKPTLERLRAQVAESALPRFTTPEGGELSRFRFTSLFGAADGIDGTAAWVDTLDAIADAHPKTRGKSVALVLADPVGFATEVNSLRLRRNALAQAVLEVPKNAHAMSSSNVLMGLKQIMLDKNLARSEETVSPVMSHGAFKDIMRVRPNPRGWPEGTRWEVLPDTEDNRVAHGWGQGRVVFPDHQARSDEWAQRQTEATWSRMAKYYDEERRAQWMSDFDGMLARKHFIPLEAYETDWRNAWQSKALFRSFERHYDSATVIDAFAGHQPGLTYIGEMEGVFIPQPFTRGKVLQAWIAELKKDVTRPDAVLLRALAGNQDEVIAATAAIYSIDASAALEHLHEERNDKLYDLGKGVLNKAGAGDMGAGVQALVRRFGWLGDALGGYSMSIAMSAAGAVGMLTEPKIATGATGIASGFAHVAAGSEAGRRLFARLQSVQLVRQCLDMALEATVSGGGLRTPVMITRMLRIDTALDLLRGEPQADGTPRAPLAETSMTRARLVDLYRSGQHYIPMTLLTDNETLARSDGDLQKAIEDGAGEAKMGDAARQMRAAAPAATVVLSEAEFAALYRSQIGAARRAVSGVSAAFGDARAIMRGLDGRLALGVMAINGVGLYGNLATIQNSEDRIAVRNAWYGMMDSSAGVMGGLLEVGLVAGTARIAARTTGQVVVAHSLKLTTLSAGAYFMGAIGGMVGGISALAKREDAKKRGDIPVARLYFSSAFSFFGLSLSAAFLTSGVAAEHLMARGIGGAAVRTVALRFGARGSFALLGMSLSGWGLVLLGAGLAFEVGAVLLKPTPLQNWTRRTYFGISGGDEIPFVKGDWAGEHAALMKALGQAATEDVDEVGENILTPEVFGDPKRMSL